VVGGALGYFAQPLIPGAKFIGAELAGSSVINGAIAGAGIGTAWGMADAGSGKTGWDNIWKYGLTGSLAGATIGFGAQTGMFSFSPQGLSWTGLGNSALFWSGAFASANSMESIEHGYQRSLIEGGVAGLIYGGVSYGYVALTDYLGGLGFKAIGLGPKWGGYALRTPINVAIARHAQAESDKQKLPGVDHAVVGAVLAGIPLLMPFSQEGGNLAVLDDFFQTNVPWLGREGQGSPLNTWYRKKFGKHRPWFPRWVKNLFR
jgi:hypothetical protein